MRRMNRNARLKLAVSMQRNKTRSIEDITAEMVEVFGPEFPNEQPLLRNLITRFYNEAKATWEDQDIES